jgi:hypothetical protein
VLAGMAFRVLDIVVAQVEVAAGRDRQGNALRGHGFTQGCQALGDQTGIEGISIAGVRRGDDVRDAIFGCHAGHLDRCLQVFGAIIQARQQMVMYVYHLAVSRVTSRLPAFLWRSSGSVRVSSCIARSRHTSPGYEV